MNEVFKEGLKILNKLQETQGDKLELVGRIIGKSFMEGHKFFVTGSGHSHTMAEEFLCTCWRIGICGSNFDN